MLIKICGFTRDADVEKACELGADAVGVILVEGSKRRVDVERAKGLFSVATAKKVVVCRPRNVVELIRLERILSPDYFQLHPSLDRAELERVRKEISAGLILVVPVPTKDPNLDVLLEQAKNLEEIADFILLDTKGPHGGGTGKTHDWRVSREIVRACEIPVLLAGGLGVHNVEKAIETVRPAGVDVASGVESSVGIKDWNLMREFIEKVRRISA